MIDEMTFCCTIESVCQTAGACSRSASATAGMAAYRQGLRSTEDPLDRIARLGFGGFRQVQIDQCGLQAAMPKILLNDFQGDARFEQMGRIGMPQCVSGNFFLKVELTCDLADRLLDGAGLDGRGADGGLFVITSFGGKEKPRMAMGFPMTAEPVQSFLRQWHVAIFGSFAAMNVEHHAFATDVTDLQVAGFFDSESHGVDGPVEQGDPLDTASVDDVVDLLDGEDFGEGLGLLEFHRGERLPVPLASPRVEELDAGEGDADGSVS